MKVRASKPDDQKKADRVFRLLVDLMKKNPDIEPSVWVSGCLGYITQAFISSGMSYEDYFEDIVTALKSYEYWWKEEE